MGDILNSNDYRIGFVKLGGEMVGLHASLIKNNILEVSEKRYGEGNNSSIPTIKLPHYLRSSIIVNIG